MVGGRFVQRRLLDTTPDTTVDTTLGLTNTPFKTPENTCSFVSLVPQ